jgi:hypothetical protein
VPVRTHRCWSHVIGGAQNAAAAGGPTGALELQAALRCRVARLVDECRITNHEIDRRPLARLFGRRTAAITFCSHLPSRMASCSCRRRLVHAARPAGARSADPSPLWSDSAQ